MDEITNETLTAAENDDTGMNSDDGAECVSQEQSEKIKKKKQLPKGLKKISDFLNAHET